MEYFSDASYDSDHPDDDDEIISLYSQRELDYMELESLLESRGPPPVIEYAKDIGVVALRGAVHDNKQIKIETVVDRLTVYSWKHFWSGRNSKIDKNALFSAEDWNAILEFSLQLLDACDFVNPTIVHVQNVMTTLLFHGGNFRNPK
jgi:hypothetical protein